MSDTVCNNGDKRIRFEDVQVGERRGNKGEDRFGTVNCCFRLFLIDER